MELTSTASATHSSTATLIAASMVVYPFYFVPGQRHLLQTNTSVRHSHWPQNKSIVGAVRPRTKVELEHDAHAPSPVGRISCRQRGRACRGASSRWPWAWSPPLLSSPTPKSKVTSHTRYPHAVYDNRLVLIVRKDGWFEFDRAKMLSGKEILTFGFSPLLLALLVSCLGKPNTR
jgi:hypothetical protein